MPVPSIEWTEERLARVAKLWAEGKSLAEIGLDVGVTKNAIAGVAHRLKLPLRGRHSRPIAERSPKAIYSLRRRERDKHGVSLTPVPSPEQRKTGAGTARSPTQPVPPTLRNGQEQDPQARIPIPKTAAAPKYSPFRSCQWPFGDPKQVDFRFCGEPTAAGRSYCACHVALAYISHQAHNAA